MIPTYNRVDFLDYCLKFHIPLAREYNIQIFISDNASTDLTKIVVEKWMKEYPLLKYHQNASNVGPDRNFEIGLKLPDTEYIWLLGDTYQIPKNGIKYLLEQTKDKKYDALVFNLANKINIETKNYQESNLLLNELGALMTCLSCLVYNKELIKRANFSRYYNSYFIQIGIIFEDIADNKKFSVFWIKSESVEGLEHPLLKKTNWSETSKVYDIACDSWTNFVMSLPPSYKLQHKMKCIMDFGKISGLFTLKNLVMLRILGLLNIEILKKYKFFFGMTIDYPIYLIYIISVMPKIVCKMIVIQYILFLKKDKKNKIITIWKR